MDFFAFLPAALLVLAATSLGAFGILAFRKIGRVGHAVMLSFSAGVMGFSVLELLANSHSSAGDATAVLGFLSGLVFLVAIDRALPHIHLLMGRKKLELSSKKAALLAGSISLHNIPEGIAVASAFAGSPALGWLVASAIALQDIPEGFLVSAPLACFGVGFGTCIGFGVLSGVVEFVAAVLGFFFLTAVTSAVPAALAFSGGAMTYVIFVELLPDAWKEGEARVALLSFAFGAAFAAGVSVMFGF